MKPLCTILGAFSLTLGACAQGFINLDFEQAVVQPFHDEGTFALIAWQLAAPGWSHSEGSDTQGVYYRDTHVGTTQAYLLVDPLSPVWRPGALEGAYSLYFRNGISNYYVGGWVNAFVAQTGLIPADSRSVRLLATGIFRVYVNGTEIPMVSLGGSAYGGDVTGFAGTVAQLKILNAARPIAEEVSVPVIADAIQFSPVQIPEPSSLALSVFLGCFAVHLLRSRRAKP